MVMAEANTIQMGIKIPGIALTTYFEIVTALHFAIVSFAYVSFHNFHTELVSFLLPTVLQHGWLWLFRLVVAAIAHGSDCQYSTW